MLKDNKFLLIIDAILLIGILGSLFLLVGYTQPLAIAPINFESETYSLLFHLPKTDFIMIDDTSRFDSADTIFLNDSFVLEEGRYFIKFFDGFNSEIRQLDVETKITLKFMVFEDKTGLFNLGDFALNVETYDKGSLVNSSLAYIGSRDE